MKKPFFFHKAERIYTDDLILGVIRQNYREEFTSQQDHSLYAT